MNAKDRDLLIAIENNDPSKAERLLNEGASPDAADPHTGLSALMIAACRGRIEMTRLLIDRGADIHRVDAREGASALHKACQSGCLPIIEMLVGAGAFIDFQTAGTGHTPLIEAMWFKNVEAARFLLEKGARIEAKTAYGFTVLDHLAFMLKVNVKGGEKIRQIKELLDGRMARDRKMAEEQTLMAATVAGDAERVKALLAKGAAVDERSPVVGGFNDAHTPLLVAAREGHTEIVRLLIAAGADVNAVEPTFGAVSLHKATYNGHAEIVRLLAACPGVHLDHRGPSNGYTPIHDALWHGYGECARILVEAGARLDLAGHDGLTPLDLSVRVLGADDPVTQLIRKCGVPETART